MDENSDIGNFCVWYCGVWYCIYGMEVYGIKVSDMLMSVSSAHQSLQSILQKCNIFTPCLELEQSRQARGRQAADIG